MHVIAGSVGRGIAVSVATVVVSLLVTCVLLPSPPLARAAAAGAAVVAVVAWMRPCRWKVMLVVGIVLAGAALVAVPQLRGVVIQTGSMTAMGMGAGSYAAVQEVTADEAAALRVGDVITYQVRSDNPAVVTHRIVGTGFDPSGEIRYITQGDSNESPDPVPVRPVQVRATLVYWVPLAGLVAVAPLWAKALVAAAVALGAIGAPAIWRRARVLHALLTNESDQTTSATSSASHDQSTPTAVHVVGS